MTEVEQSDAQTPQFLLTLLMYIALRMESRRVRARPPRRLASSRLVQAPQSRSCLCKITTASTNVTSRFWFSTRMQREHLILLCIPTRHTHYLSFHHSLVVEL
jgi:hypothetical protein